MTRTITWLHLSDLHARMRDDWDAKLITDTLILDLRSMQRDYRLRPDLIFFTGDIAYGAANGERMEDQYARVRTFLDSVRKSFEPELATRDIYIVPGNHDVDRNEITPDQTNWLRHRDRTLPEILHAMRDGKKQWRAWMERLTAYRNFIKAYGLLHLTPDDPHLIWADSKDIASLRVGIAGFNSVWSSADQEDKGKLWCGVEWQVSELVRKMGPVDLSFALIHHPGNWFTPHEDPAAMRYLQQMFPVILHGHEHADWIQVDRDGRVIISAGACYQCSWMENGYSFGTLDIDNRLSSVWLRQWDRTGRGWVARNIANKTRDGCWPLGKLNWLSQVIASEPLPVNGSGSVSSGYSGDHDSEVADHYTQRFCKNVIDQHDVLELFGCDIPRELQRHLLSVAYISLNLTTTGSLEEDAGDDEEKPVESTRLSEVQVGDEPALKTASIGEVLGSFSPSKARLLIHGPAGAGKSTLLRWCAIRAAHNMLATGDADRSEHDAPGSAADPTRLSMAWRNKVPILIRLRDCPSGRLPAAADLPRFLAKHLPSAPTDWMTTILANGQALVLFDGVDEVHRDKRPQLAEEISLLVRTYPECTYVVSTRPGAVEDGWLDRLDFTEAQVEPMSRGDREEFIDRWYRSAALELRHRPRPGEDLAQTASRLKIDLAAQSELAALATNPLLCAMICALYRERQERLPETSSELCEALCHMLIHRRERESPGLEDAHFVTVWRELSYSQKKGLLSDLAWHMVKAGDSLITDNIAAKLVAEGLASTPGRSEREASEVLAALVERSGVLRPAGDDRVDFLHNTLKEYLAADVVVESGQWQVLADHADDAAWQPVILFALSLAGAAFNSSLVGSLLDRAQESTRRTSSRGSRNLTKAERAALTAAKRREFFLVRCRSVAKRLASEVSTKIDRIARNFLPPATMLETEALAQVGQRILLYSSKNLGDPTWWQRQTSPMCVRCLRLLRKIDGPQAKAILMRIKILPSGYPQLHAEWFMASSELASNEMPSWPFHYGNSNINLSYSNVRDLGPLAALSDIDTLNISFTRVADLSPVSHLTTIRRLEAAQCPLSDISPLSELSTLAYLNLASTRIDSLTSLKKLKLLKYLNLNGTAIKDLAPLNELIALEEIHLVRAFVEDLSALVNLKHLKHLSLAQSKNADIRSLAKLASLEVLDLTSASVDLEPLTQLTSLRRLSLRQMQGDDYGFLAKLTTLKELDLMGTQIVDLAPLEGLRELERLTLWGTRISNVRVLASLSALKNLDLEGTQVTDLAPLSLLPLEVLDLFGTRGCSMKPLAEIQSLHRLILDSDTFPVDDIKKFTERRPDVVIVRRRPDRSEELWAHRGRALIDETGG